MIVNTEVQKKGRLHLAKVVKLGCPKERAFELSLEEA